MRSRREHDARRTVGLGGGPDAVDGVGAQHHGDDADEEVGDVPPLLLVLLRVGLVQMVNYDETVYRMLRKTVSNQIFRLKFPIFIRKSGFSVLYA